MNSKIRDKKNKNDKSLGVIKIFKNKKNDNNNICKNPNDNYYFINSHNNKNKNNNNINNNKSNINSIINSNICTHRVNKIFVDKNKYNKNIEKNKDNKFTKTILLKENPLFRNNTTQLLKNHTISYDAKFNELNNNSMNESKTFINNNHDFTLQNKKNKIKKIRNTILLKNIENSKYYTIFKKRKSKRIKNRINRSIDNNMLKRSLNSQNKENHNSSNIRILNNKIIDTKFDPEYKNLTELCLNQGKIIFRLVDDVQNLNNQIEKKNKHINELNLQLDNYKNNYNTFNKINE